MASKSLIFEIFGKDTSASSTLKNLDKNVGSLKKSFGGLATAAGIAFSAEAAISFGKETVAVASNMQKAQVNLETAVKNSGASWSTYSTKVEAADKAGQSLGFTNADTTLALANLTTGLKDPTKALQYLSLAQDLARAKGMDLNAAALLVTKASEGQIRPLKALGIDLNVTAGGAAQVAKAQEKVAAAQQKVNDILAKYPSAAEPASKSHAAYQTAVENLSKAQDAYNNKASTGDQILQTLSERLKGQASNAVETNAGKLDVLNAKLDAAKEKIGNGLLKSLGKLADWATSASGGKTIDSVANGITGIIDAIAASPNPIATFIGGVGLLTGAFIGLDAAMDSNPIGAIVLALELIIGLIAVASTDFGGFNEKYGQFIFGLYAGATGIAKVIGGAFDALVNGAINALNLILTPLNDVLKVAGIAPIKIGHIDTTGGLANLQSTFQGVSNFAGGNIPGAGTSVAVGSGANNAGARMAFADGAIIRATPGGVNINGTFAEKGSDELIMPLTQQNMASLGGGTNVTIYQAMDPVATSNAVVRRLNLARA